MGKSDRRIAIFGGSFNPIHNGHLNTIQFVLQNSDISQVVVLPAAQAPHKKAKNLESFRHRFRMLRAAVKETGQEREIRLSVFEKRLPKPNYTFFTLSEMNKLCNAEFNIVIGYDMYEYLPKWKNYQELIEKYHFLVLNRETDTENKDSQSFTFLQNEEWPISSTEIRQLYAQNKYEDAKQFLPSSVHQYILTKKLYQNV